MASASRRRVGGIINALLRPADRMKVACLAQLTNAIATIMTNLNGMFRQTIFYPFRRALQYARGPALDVLAESPSTYEVAGMGPISPLAATATCNPEDGKLALFVLNRALSKAHQVEVNGEGNAGVPSLVSWSLTGDDLKAVNGFDAPDKVAPQAAEKACSSAGRTILELPPHSYSVFQWAT